MIGPGNTGSPPGRKGWLQNGFCQGWKGQVVRQDQFGLGQFVQGPGSPFPLPSIPLAQAFRYWWSVKSIRVRYSIHRTRDDGVNPPDHYTSDNDTGFQLYTHGTKSTPAGSGTNIVQRQDFLNGDRTLNSRVVDRYLRTTDQGSINHQCMGVNFEGGTDPTFINWIYIMGSGNLNQFGTFQNNLLGGLAVDDSTPGNVFMALNIVHIDSATRPLLVGTLQGSNPDLPDSLPGDFSATLDGIPFSMFWHQNDTFTTVNPGGFFEITTQDS